MKLSRKRIKSQTLPKLKVFNLETLRKMTISEKKKLWQSLTPNSPYAEILVREALEKAITVSTKINPKGQLYIKSKNLIYVTGTKIILFIDPKTRKTYIFNTSKEKT